ncbi:hypothetical protein B0H65DRAFT_567165 [Neurospora tetraspora]|uniref:Uncharacterized protein n=1 Tax=Neurospora tetraspora TaxID=94610 RepID=A0AAE0JJI6_9PEZI|nr:hypothetical protein B0H65DRAFT_567165 [Neurospora tetraspora]
MSSTNSSNIPSSLSNVRHLKTRGRLANLKLFKFRPTTDPVLVLPTAHSSTRSQSTSLKDIGPQRCLTTSMQPKGRKEAVNVIMGKDDRLLVVVEKTQPSEAQETPKTGFRGWLSRNPIDDSIAKMQRALDKKSVEPEETPHQQSESAKEPEVRLTIEEVEEEDGAMLNKYKVTVVMKKPHA